MIQTNVIRFWFDSRFKSESFTSLPSAAVTAERQTMYAPLSLAADKYSDF